MSVCAACFCCVLALGVEKAYALDDQQQAVLGQAQTALKNAEADLSAARGSAGTAANPATGSRAKLTAVRLDSAQQRLKQAAELLGKLPADDDAVAVEKKRYDTAAAGVAEVRAVINPPAPADSGSSQANNKTAKSDALAAQQPAVENAPKLHYTQEELLKNANWYLRETNGYADKAAAVVARLDGADNKPVHSEVVAAMGDIETGMKKHALAVEYINQLPGDHPLVRQAADAVNQAGDRLGALASRLGAADAELGKLAGIGNYPDYDKDLELLGDFIRRYNDFNLAAQQPEELARVIAEDGQVLAEIQRIAKTYLPLVEQKTAESERIERQFNYFQEKRGAFAAALIEYKNGLPDEFESDIKEALEIAKQGVAEQKPLFFGKDSGIEQRLGWAEQKLIVLRAFSEEEAKFYAERLAEVRTQVNYMAKALEGKIIQENTLPPNRYTDGDRDALIELAKEAWARQQADAEVLTACIPSQAWERSTRWEWSAGAFHKVDKSHIQVQLIVKHDDKLAVIRPVNLYKNHLKGDTINAWSMDAIEDELIPQRFLMLEKVE